MHERPSGTDIPGGFSEGHGGHVPDAAAEEHLHGAISAGATDGGGAVSRRASAKQEPGDGRDALHRMQPLRAGVPGKPDRGGMGTRRRDAAKGVDHVYV